MLGEGSSCGNILVIGTAVLDRLLYVSKYPKADTKLQCTSIVECGGGNAANTASGIARLGQGLNPYSGGTEDGEKINDDGKEKTVHNAPGVIVKLLTKVASDRVGEFLVQELEDYGVDLTSPLLVRGTDTESSAVCTIIVAKDDEPPTRTCIFDSGTVGTLMPSHIRSLDAINPGTNSFGGNINNNSNNTRATNASYDDVWENVNHLHSDTRHTEAAVFLARQANQRNIPVSVDVERDRYSEEFDDLIDRASLVFTNENLMKEIIQRRVLSANDDGDGDAGTNTDTNLVGTIEYMPFHDFYHDVVLLCYRLHTLAKNKSRELVVTRGELGAVHCKMEKSEIQCDVKVQKDNDEDDGSTSLTIPQMTIKILERHKHWLKIELQAIHTLESDGFRGKLETFTFILRAVGPPKDITIVDTTGSGDAFIAGYLFSRIILGRMRGEKEVQQAMLPKSEPSSSSCSLLKADESPSSSKEEILFHLRFAAWVAGRKIGGTGARQSLPAWKDVIHDLCDEKRGRGSNLIGIMSERLNDKVHPYEVR